jgi:hypothetical protein
MDTTRNVSLPTLMAVAATRGMLGAGIGLLLAGRAGNRRVRIGQVLVAIGAISTIPLARRIFGRDSADDYVNAARYQ